ncbi:MAG: GntR family transcriptional regulator [Prevotella sp.]|nr:GntR family transcriptional regulator [Prevotella sp.]
MSFKNDKAIYLQMAERLCDDILAGKYKSDERIPSVREYAVMLEVNTNTAVKAYDELSREGIIYNRRGLGYFVASDAAERIRGHRREAFFKEMLPDVFRQMTLLGIDIEEIEERWIKSKKVKK